MHSRGKAMLSMALSKMQNEKKEALPPNESTLAKDHISEPLKNKEVDRDVRESESNDYIQSSSSTASLSSSSSSSSTSSTSCDNELDSDDSVADKHYVPDYEEDTDSADDDQPSTNITDGREVEVATIMNEPSNVGVEVDAVLYETQSAIGQIGISENVPILVSPSKKGFKRKACPEKWRRNVQKRLRNQGKAYEMKSKYNKEREERKMKPPCHANCRLKCSFKFTEEERNRIFTSYWNLSDITKQREFIRNSIQEVQTRYRYIRVGGTRQQRRLNSAFYLLKNCDRIRVCKVFFKNTLDINDRPIRTVMEKKDKVADVVMEEDRRGKHGNHCTVDDQIREKINSHIQSIPRVESHFTRANTTRTFIDGSKSIAEIHRDYVANCQKEGLPFGNYTLFHRIFTQEHNISFFTPKKDQCDTCTSYHNADEKEKELLKGSYEVHQNEKELSRKEKSIDKATSDSVVAVYDLQAVMQLPKGDVSVFYYKSKLNVLNFTIYDIKTNKCDCFVWDESNGHRGVNELGTCVLKYIKSVIESGKKDIIFYSDNCAGQQKNKFMLALYLYAVKELDLNSITHKYLVKGHTQNEGDAAHSLIERQNKRLLKSGPIYVPETFATSIRIAKKKGDPFNVFHLGFDDFYNIKAIANDIGPMNVKDLRISDIKVLKVTKESQSTVLYKYSYADEFKEYTLLKHGKKSKDLRLLPCFKEKPGIPHKKKDDLMELCKKNLIPKHHHKFYEGL